MKKSLLFLLTLVSLTSFAGDVFTPATAPTTKGVHELCAGSSKTFGYGAGTQVGEILTAYGMKFGICKRPAREYGYYTMAGKIVTPVVGETRADAEDYCENNRSKAFGLPAGTVVGKPLYANGRVVVACMRRYR